MSKHATIPKSKQPQTSKRKKSRLKQNAVRPKQSKHFLRAHPSPNIDIVRASQISHQNRGYPSTHTQQSRPEMNKICTRGGHARDHGPGQIAQLHICIEGCIRDTPTCNLIFAMSIPSPPGLETAAFAPRPGFTYPASCPRMGLLSANISPLLGGTHSGFAVSFCLCRWLSIWGA